MVVAGTGRLDLAHVVAARDPSGRLQALFTLRLPQAAAKLTGLPFLCGPFPSRSTARLHNVLRRQRLLSRQRMSAGWSHRNVT